MSAINLIMNSQKPKTSPTKLKVVVLGQSNVGKSGKLKNNIFILNCAWVIFGDFYELLELKINRYKCLQSDQMLQKKKINLTKYSDAS